VKIAIKLTFGELGYIGKPFWPERNTLINISKDVHPKLAGAKREAAIAAACEKRGLSPENYREIQERAARPFYTANEARDGEIVIPARVFQSFLNNASQEAPKVIPKIASKGLTFVGVKVSNGNGGAWLRTGKKESDAKMFSRFTKLEESNQRSWQEDAYIYDFDAEGVIDLDESVIKSGDLRKLVEYGGRWYGIGSARPQGYGRFTVTRWEEI
jgi:hypothetical protein